jgi:hypothetical protein
MKDRELNLCHDNCHPLAEQLDEETVAFVANVPKPFLHVLNDGNQSITSLSLTYKVEVI